jgi:chemotaxis protein methyltransferase CheR
MAATMASLMEALKAALKAAPAAAGPPAHLAVPVPPLVGLPMDALAQTRGEAAALAGRPRLHAPPVVEELELELLLEAVFQLHGHDFRGYDRAALRRKLDEVMTELGAATLSALQDKVLHDPTASAALLRGVYASPTLMFDDPADIALLRMSLGVCLHGAALPRVWLADCAGAQQAWTMAILLEQEQLGARTEIYATVASDEQLAEAQQASLPLDRLTELQGNYTRSGGTGRLLDYFEVDGNRAVLLPQLRSRIIWAQYNLVTDSSFNEFQLILCRRALADFGPLLRHRVLRLFNDSLAPFGLLALDRPLDPDDPLAARYQPVFPHQPWYKRMG